MKQVEPQSITNINKKLGKLREFFRWIERRYDECPANPIEGIALSNRVTPKEREHFTDADLQQILSKEYLPSTVHRMDKDTRFYIKHGVTYYWVFLIGIYSGMRTEEICKLRVDELKKEDGIWFFDIKDKVKTRNSVRRVPIHEKLIGNITHHEASIQDQHLAALKSIVEKRKRQIKAEEKAKQVDEPLELAASDS